MNRYPISSAERQDCRQTILDEAIERAKRDHASGYFSMKCQGTHSEYGLPAHRTAPVGGCLNNGSTCLCPCHDDQPRVAS